MKKIFAVYDTKAEAFGAPIFDETRGVALRGFADAVANPNSVFAKHPEDFALYELGEYDPNTAKFTLHDRPVHLYAAVAVTNQLEVARHAEKVDAVLK